MSSKRRPAAAMILAYAALLGCAGLGAWRWWWAPKSAAAAARETAELVALREATIETLGQFGIEVALDDHLAEADTLRWRAPGECVEVYRVRIDERHRDEGVALFLGRDEEHATLHLALVADPTRAGREGPSPALGLLIAADEEPRLRELWWGERVVGPSAPDFACRRRSWDPLEDALALGWPRLPGARVPVGERWRGAAVEGRCHETVCVEPDGSFGHAVPCRAPPWTERLAGAQGDLALILGDWNDGHDPARPEIGILTSRELVLDEGRPLYLRAVIDQRWAGVRRELSLVRIDDCGRRSLATPADRPRVDETRARLADQIRARLSRPD
ncbi:MAG: hypothetical protein R6X02_22430 [Enhygromyxa sp.]